MDVERIQKINNLALNLMKQGLATDREDAINQAEKIFRNRDSDDYRGIKETMAEVKAEATPEKRTASNEEELSTEGVKEILEKNTKFIVNKLRIFQEKIIQLEKEIASMRTTMTYNRLPTASEIKANVDAPKDVPTKELKQENTSNQSEENHPRSGNFEEEDVSIEKFFYMGSK